MTKICQTQCFLAKQDPQENLRMQFLILNKLNLKVSLDPYYCQLTDYSNLIRPEYERITGKTTPSHAIIITKISTRGFARYQGSCPFIVTIKCHDFSRRKDLWIPQTGKCYFCYFLHLHY